MMVKRDAKRVASELDNLKAQDAAAIINHALSSGRSLSKDNYKNDDLIVSLADAYENRRARQVTEWEMHQHVAKVF
jgi:hypothetical protein